MKEHCWGSPWRRGVEVTPPLNEGIVEELPRLLNPTHDNPIRHNRCRVIRRPPSQCDYQTWDTVCSRSI